MYYDIISANAQEEIKDELQAHAEEVAKTYGKDLDEWDTEGLHDAAFNEDYYIIGYHNASEWLAKYKVAPLQALTFVHEWEKEHFGESRQYDNSEDLVTMIAYILGHEVVRDALQCVLSERDHMNRFANAVRSFTGPALR